MSNQPWSEQFRLIAKEYVELDKAATILEEMKSAVLSQKMKALGDLPVSHAEREVKASAEWQDYINRLIDARSAANLKKYHLEYIKMKFSEELSDGANRRAEMKL